MGFFEKVKNMFTEEVEEDDVKVEQIKKEVTKVAIESPNIKKDEDEKVENFTFNTETQINQPVFFDDNDFKDLKLDDKPKEVKEEKKVREVYGTRIQEPVKEEKKNFKPTPIISPVYGILDKNYHKEDIVSRSEVVHENDIQLSSIDAIRNKAYGTLEDELENTLFGSNSILFKKDEEETIEELEIKEVDDDILTDLTDDIGKELDELLIKKEKYIEDKIEDANIKDDDLLDFIDSTLYKDGDEDNDN